MFDQLQFVEVSPTRPLLEAGEVSRMRLIVEAFDKLKFVERFASC